MSMDSQYSAKLSTFLKSFTLLAFMVLPCRLTAAETHRVTLMKDFSPYINVHPVGLFVGSLAGEFGFSFAEKWALGLMGSFAQERWLGEGYDGMSYGLSGYHYFTGFASDSIYLKGGFERGHIDMEKRNADTEGGDVRGTINYNQVKLLAGYHWIWSNGINLNLGGGFNFMTADSNFGKKQYVRLGNIKTRIPNGSASGFVPNVEFSMGVQI